MPDLKHSLSGVDLQHLKHIAEKWGIPLQAPDAREALPLLVEGITDPALVDEMLEALPGRAREAVTWLVERDGRAPWDAFSRRFGEVREMGLGKRDRERPDLDPISPAETLWYRAFLGRGFFDTESGPQEFAYLPNDLRSIIVSLHYPSQDEDRTQEETLLARKATPEERAVPWLASGQALHHTCTLLAAHRMGIEPDLHLPDLHHHEIHFYDRLLMTADLLDEDSRVQPDHVRDFFELTRSNALLYLWRAWRTSPEHNDLHLTPGLTAEGTWDNRPLAVRRFVLDILAQLPPDTWLSTSGFVSRIKQHHPDFQRAAGEYDSWYIKDVETGEYLRGFEHWDEVEGALLRYFLSGPLHWLGVLDLASLDEGRKTHTAFRISSLGQHLLADQPPPVPQPDPDPVHLRSKGLMRISKKVPRKVRYQLARFCEWQPVKKDAYMYFLTPASLKRARGQGLEVAHLLALLDKHAELVPPNITQALQRWEQKGIQASLEKETVLRLGSPAMLQALQQSKARRFLREQLGPTAVVIREGSESKLVEALAEMGFLTEVPHQLGDFPYPESQGDQSS